jgi:uncharacterized membrane protein YqjE
MTSMPESEQVPGGVRGSLRRLADSVVGLLQTRVELFAVEFQEERLRTIRLLVAVSLAVAIGIAGLQVIIGALALVMWNVAGYWGLAGLAAVAMLTSGILLWAIQRRIMQSPAPFSGTTAEFKKDAALLRPKS